MRIYMELISMDDLSLPRVTDCNTLTVAQNLYHIMSMGQYHNNLRIKKACMLLQSTLLSVGEIANRLGFSDVLYFSKKFHVYSGLSPSDYRKQAQMRY